MWYVGVVSGTCVRCVVECVYLGVRVVYVCYVEVYVGVVYKCMGCVVFRCGV